MYLNRRVFVMQINVYHRIHLQIKGSDKYADALADLRSLCSIWQNNIFLRLPSYVVRQYDVFRIFPNTLYVLYCYLKHNSILRFFLMYLLVIYHEHY